jgi:NitT/TauT family transport system substrate-binding protein
MKGLEMTTRNLNNKQHLSDAFQGRRQHLTGTSLDRRAFLILGGAAAAAIALPSALTGCSAPAAGGGGGSTTGSSAPTTPAEEFPLGKIQIQALAAGSCATPTYVAKEKGFWAEEGLDVEFVSGTFQQQKDGLASGSFIVTNGDFQFFPAINEGLDAKVIGGMHEGCIKLLVPADSPIQTVAELRGKLIGVDEIGGTPWAITSVALADAGIDPSEEAGAVTFAPYDLTVLEEVANRGEVDAFAAWDPFATIAEQNGSRVLVDIGTHPLFAGKFCCFLYASGIAIEQNPGQVKAVLNGWNKAIEWTAANPEEAAKIITDGSEHEPYVASDDIDLLVTLIKSYHYAPGHNAQSIEDTYENVLYFADALKDTGYLPADLDAKAFADKAVVDISRL